MTLLTEVYERPLDPGYAARAARRREGKHMGPRRSLKAGSLAVGVIVGLVLATAAVSLRAPTSPGALTRQTLVKDIREVQATIQERVQTLEISRIEVSDLEDDLIAVSNPKLLESLRQEETLAGSGPAIGPGIIVTLKDAQDSATDGSAGEHARVTDFDLQLLTNGLWAAGAEGISINGIRLTALSSIRSAGQVVMVDLLQVTSPYRVEVIGDPAKLESYLNRSVTQHHLAQLSQLYGISSTITQSQELKLKAGWRTGLAAAVPDGDILDYASKATVKPGDR